VVINAPANSEKNMYVQSLQVNGVNHDKNWVDHSLLMKGATLNFNMTATPNKTRGVNVSAYPYSFSKDEKPKAF
jgi:putative alpha-1,2-mannosidase